MRLKHKDNANFCYKCGNRLKATDLLKFYQTILVPSNKINMGKNRTRELFDVFPFLLRKKINNIAEFVVIHDFPYADRGIANTKYHLCEDRGWKHVTLTQDYIKKLINDGFSWYHVFEIEKLY